ncbi:MAG: hypothetical protein EOR04_25920 [Mesorhizobium sp.]|nr:MAG: hypothetical protein EOR04_25920 [Mesorhizobium sp.]
MLMVGPTGSGKSMLAQRLTFDDMKHQARNELAKYLESGLRYSG